MTVEATLEHPFFVFGQGWSSCNPERTLQRFGLTCHSLSVGDVCISLTHKDTNSHAAEVIAQQQREGSVHKKEKRPSQISPPGGSSSSDVSKEGAHARVSSPHRTAADGGGGGGGGGRNTTTGVTSSQGQLEPVPELYTVESLRDKPSSGDDPRQSRPPQSSGLPRKRRWSAPDQFSSEEGPIDVVGGTSPHPSPTPEGAESPSPSKSQTPSTEMKDEEEEEEEQDDSSE